MKQKEDTIVVRKDDYELMSSWLRNAEVRNVYDRHNVEGLRAELRRATVVTKEYFPMNVVRLNSTVIIQDETADDVFQLTVVTPEKANIRERMISFLAPIGTALLGFREGQKVKWQVPSGQKIFTILKVLNVG